MSGNPTVLTIHRPVVDDHAVHFSWTATPRTALYRRESFSLRFPPGVDLGSVPPAFWDRASLLVLHTHAALLDPCTIEVRWSITDREAAAIAQQVRAVKDTCDYYAGNEPGDATFRIHTSATTSPLAGFAGSANRHDSAVAAFSGGRDGIVQAAMLRAACVPVTLVTVTSPMPPSNDHANAWRRRSLATAPARLDASFVEVRSDARSCWRHSWALENGRASVGIHEITDQVLYTVTCAAVALAQGVGEVYLAAETETHFATVVAGRVIQLQQLSSALATMTTMQILLDDLDISLRCATAPFRSWQVSTLLARKAAECIDLVASCWRVNADIRSCNACSTCLSRSLFLLANGIDERRIGVDLDELGAWAAQWTPHLTRGSDESPKQRVSRSNAEATLRAVSSMSHAARALPLSGQDAGRREWIHELNDRLGGDQIAPHVGWCRDLLWLGGPLLRAVSTQWGNELFGTESVDGDLVAPALRLAGEISSGVAPLLVHR